MNKNEFGKILIMRSLLALIAILTLSCIGFFEKCDDSKNVAEQYCDAFSSINECELDCKQKNGKWNDCIGPSFCSECGICTDDCQEGCE